MKNAELKYIQFRNDNITEIIEFINQLDLAYSTATFIDNKGITEGMQINLKAKHKNKINSIYLRDNDYLVLEDDRLRKYSKQTFEHCFKIYKYDFSRKKGKKYYYITEINNIVSNSETYSLYDDNHYTVNNYFPNREIAEKFAKIQTLQRKLLRFSLENGMNEIDWNDEYTKKYYIFYNPRVDTFYVDWLYFYKDIVTVYFKDKEIAEKALELFKDDLEEVQNIKW